MIRKYLIAFSLLTVLAVHAGTPKLSGADKDWARGFLKQLRGDMETASKSGPNTQQITTFSNSVVSLLEQSVLPRIAELAFELKKIETANPSTDEKKLAKATERKAQILSQIEFIASNAKKYFTFGWYSKDRLSYGENDPNYKYIEENLARYGFKLTTTGETLKYSVNAQEFQKKAAKIRKEVESQMAEHYAGDFTKFYDEKDYKIGDALRALNF